MISYLSERMLLRTADFQSDLKTYGLQVHSGLVDIYLPIIDGTLIFDNSYGKHELIAHKMGTDRLKIIDQEKFEGLKKIYESKG